MVFYLCPKTDDGVFCIGSKQLAPFSYLVQINTPSHSHGTAHLALSPFVLMQYIFHSVKA